MMVTKQAGASQSFRDTVSRGLPGWANETRLGAVLIIASIVVPVFAHSSYWLHILLLVNLYVVVAVCQNLLLADAGQVSFGQGAVFGVAAYTVGIVSGLNGHPLGLGLLAGLVAGIALGLLFALPALRVKGFYLGFVTIAAATVMPEMLNAFSDVTNGINGISLRVRWLQQPWVLGFSPLALAIMTLGVGTLFAHDFLRRTSVGRLMRVAASSPETALTLGHRPGVVRSLAFLIAAVGTSLAGVLYGPLLGFLSPDAFHFDLSIFFFFAVIVGGSGRLLGPLVGTAILYLVPNVLLVDLVEYRLVGYGVTALLIMLLFPDGVVGTIARRIRLQSASTRPALLSSGPLLELRPGQGAARQENGNDAAEAAVKVFGARRRYGQVIALDGVDLDVAPGTIHGLVGPNGSGKTTLLNVLSGLSRLDSGTVSLFGVRADAMHASAIARLGVARTFQTPRIFDDLTVRENLQLGLDANRGTKDEAFIAAFEAISKPLADCRPDELPHAQRRMLELLRCIATGPRLLFLDEPAAGLSGEERKRFAELLRLLRDELDLTVVLVEHDLALVWRLADEITVLDAGRVVESGVPDKVVENPAVQKLFWGERDA
jgi:branched-chain amino acid transport system permease protein